MSAWPSCSMIRLQTVDWGGKIIIAMQRMHRVFECVCAFCAFRFSLSLSLSLSHLAACSAPRYANQKWCFHFGWRVVASAGAHAAVVAAVLRQAVAIHMMVMVRMVLGTHSAARFSCLVFGAELLFCLIFLFVKSYLCGAAGRCVVSSSAIFTALRVYLQMWGYFSDVSTQHRKKIEDRTTDEHE